MADCDVGIIYCHKYDERVTRENWIFQRFDFCSQILVSSVIVFSSNHIMDTIIEIITCDLLIENRIINPGVRFECAR